MLINFNFLFPFSKNGEIKVEDPVIQKSEAVEAQVNEVKVVMDQNIQSMMERGEKLEDLEHKTGKKSESDNLCSFIYLFIYQF